MLNKLVPIAHESFHGIEYKQENSYQPSRLTSLLGTCDGERGRQDRRKFCTLPHHDLKLNP